MLDFKKVYIYTTGKRFEPIIFRHLSEYMSLKHPCPSILVKDDINQNNVSNLFDLTQYGTPEVVLADPVFKYSIRADWIRAFNEYGVEIDDYLEKTFQNISEYDTDDIPVWDEDESLFEPRNISDLVTNFVSRSFIITSEFAPDEVLNIVDGFGNISGASTVSGTDITLGTSSSIFNEDPRIEVFVNGINTPKGHLVYYVSSLKIRTLLGWDINDLVMIKVPSDFAI